MLKLDENTLPKEIQKIIGNEYLFQLHLDEYNLKYGKDLKECRSKCFKNVKKVLSKLLQRRKKTELFCIYYLTLQVFMYFILLLIIIFLTLQDQTECTE